MLKYLQRVNDQRDAYIFIVWNFKIIHSNNPRYICYVKYCWLASEESNVYIIFCIIIDIIYIYQNWKLTR